MRNSDLNIAYGMLADSLRRAARDDVDEVRVRLNQKEALAALLCMEEAGAAHKGYTRKMLEEAKNGPAWVPDWARNLIKK